MLLTLAWYFSQKKGGAVSGISIGIATLLRLWPIIFLIPFIISRKRNAIYSFLGTMILGVLFTFIFLNIETYLNYFTHVQTVENIYVLHLGNGSFISLIAKLLLFFGFSNINSIFIAKLSGIVIFSILVIIFIYKIKNHIKNKQIFNLSLSIFLSLMYFIFPTIWEWTLSIFTINFFIIYKALIDLKYTSKKTWIYLFYYLLFFVLFRFIANKCLPPNISSIEVDIRYLILNNITLLFGVVYLLVLQLHLVSKILKRT